MRELEVLETLNGHKIQAFKGDYIAKKIKKIGLYEKETLSFIRGHLSSIVRPIIFDVGANIGNHTLDFSTYAEKVYSFEPVEFIFDVLQQNIKKNNITNVVCINKALSDAEGEDRIYLCDGNVGASSIVARGAAKEVVMISKIVGDEFCKSEGIKRLDFIKIDVEGHEKNAITGLMKTIKKYKPIIMMEWNDKDAIAVFNDDGLLGELLQIYNISVLGNNYDPGYWKGRLFWKVRRKLTRLFLKKKPRLYRFDEQDIYRNVLLIPK